VLCVVGLSSLSKVEKSFFFLSRKGGRGCVFAVFGPVPEKEILDSIAHGSIIRVFTVSYGLKVEILIKSSSYFGLLRY